MTSEKLIFTIFSSLALLCAAMVIRAKNPVHSVLFLILVFCNASGLLILLGLDFFAMMFLVVYVGAIAVLFLFVVMMLNITQAEIRENILRYFPIGGLIGLIFLLEVFVGLGIDLLPFLSFPGEEYFQISSLHFASWIENQSQLHNLESIGHILYTDYIFLFILSSLILLVAMIGAIVLTMQQRIEVKRQEVFEQNIREFSKTLQKIRPIPTAPLVPFGTKGTN